MRRIFGLVFCTLLPGLAWADGPAALAQAIAAYKAGHYAQALPVLQKAAAAGNADAETDLGDMYYNGLGVEKDEDTAFYLQNQAAAQHNGEAEYRLGGMYDDSGQDDKGFAWYSKAAADGNADGEADLGYDYLYADGVKEDDSLAFTWFQRAAAENNAFAQYELARLYHHGWGVDEDDAAALHYMNLAAAQGEADAENALGEYYENGEIVKQDYHQALHWFLLAANEKCGCAAYNLGDMYENGDGMTPDKATALTWYERGAALGNSGSENSLGDFYRTGTATQVDDTKAAYWYRKAVEQDNTQAAIHLALLYHNGLGVEQNQTEADKLLHFAVQGDDTEHEQNVAWALYDDRDYTDALKYFQPAAEKSEPYAQIDLGYMYEQGQAVKQSYQMELTWALITYSVIHAPNPPNLSFDPTDIDKFVKIHMSVSIPHLTKAQIAAAKLDAASWLTAHGYPYDDDALPAAPRPSWVGYAALIGGIFIIYGLVKLNARTQVK